ncbi:MAG: PQQ-binding-like beta-propeller repeat protein [Ignavibacteriales bacterium]|nr:PQQ-binding-like beta-propeller repeat protein [Ignavibacteriales bacterium]
MESKRLLLALFLFSSCAGLRVNRSLRVAQDDWVTAGGDPARTNRSSTIVLPPLVEKWQYNTVAGITASPLVRDSVIVLGTLNGEIQLVNFLDGKRISYVALDAPIAGTPVWNGTSIIVPLSSSNQSLISVALKGSDRAWSLALGPIESSPLLFKDRVYVTTLEGKVFCLNVDDGTEIWQFKANGNNGRKPIRSSPASDGNILFFGSDDGGVYAVGAQEGKLRWKFRTNGSVFATPIVFEKQVVVGSLDGSVYCLGTESGELVWRFDTKSRIYGSASTDGKRIFVGSSDGTCYALDAKNGQLAWSAAAKSVINTPPLVAGNLVYVGSLDRTLRAYDIQSGKILWEYSTPGRIRVSPLVWRNTLLVVSEDRLLLALKPLEDV